MGRVNGVDGQGRTYFIGVLEQQRMAKTPAVWLKYYERPKLCGDNSEWMESATLLKVVNGIEQYIEITDEFLSAFFHSFPALGQLGILSECRVIPCALRVRSQIHQCSS